MDGDTDDRPDGRTEPAHGHDNHDTSAAGDERVDSALARLDDLDGIDLSGHAGIYDELHRSLAAVLDDPAAVSEQ